MAADALSKLGKYEIRGTLGKGAMGIVYDGFDPVIQRRVAIKTIARRSIDPVESSELLARFKREAQAAGRLNHPGIVAIHDYGEDDGLAYIAMEFIKGIELRRYFESQQRFPLTDIVRIMCEILDALDHAHRNGVVHRDVKPGNIMITDEGRVKVADFGVARIESSMMTQVGMRIGTPAYMSPEQHQGLPADGRSDLFSAGVILYEFLAGERPFIGDGYALVQRILLQDAIVPSRINSTIPRALDAVTMRALAKRPEDRFASAREFAEACREAATGEAVGAGVDYVLHDRTLRLNGRSAISLPVSAPGWKSGDKSANSGGSNPTELSLEAELEYWKEIKDSSEAADFETFLRSFPESRFAPLARRRMNRFETESKARDAGEQAQRHPDERTRIEPEAATRAAAEEAIRRADADDRRRSEAPSRHQADEPGRAEEGKRTLVEADIGHAAEDLAAKEMPGPVRQEADARKSAKARPHKRRDLDWRRIDAQEPKLTPRAGGEADDLLAPVDLFPRIVADGVPMPPHRFPAGASRKPRRLPIALAVVVLIGSGTWYAARPELAPIVDPIVAALRVRAETTWGQLRQQWPAQETKQPVQVQQAQETKHPVQLEKGSEPARRAEEQRSDAEALQAERSRQVALARQKEEAVRAAAAHSYQRALALLDQGRSSEGVRLLRQLAFDGHGAAAKTLGDLYSSGEKVLLDRQEASLFYAIAERNGVKLDRSPFVRR